MVYDPKATLKAIQNKLATAGRYNTVAIGDPVKAPEIGLAAHITLVSAVGEEAVLNAVSGPVRVRISFYHPVEPSPEAAELAIGAAPFDFWQDVMGDFDLGVAAVRNVQPDISAEWQYAEIGETQFRMCEVELDVFVNDIVTTVA